MGKSITTDTQIRSLKPGKTPYTKTIQSSKLDKGTLLLIVNPGGKKSFKTRYRYDGKQKGFYIGSYPSTSLAEAVKRHNEAMKALDAGQDPKIYFAHKLADLKNKINLQQLFEKWLEAKKTDKNLSLQTISRHKWRWEKYLKDELAILQVDATQRQHLTNTLEKIRKKSKEESRKSLSTLNMMFNYAVSAGYIRDNPLLGIKASDLGLQASKPRNRWLNLSELVKLWKYLGDFKNKISIQSRIAIKIAILTGARRTEITQMEWSELDFDSQIWTIPAHRAKNKIEHEIFLSDLNISLLKQINETTEDYKYVFVSPQKASKGIDEPLSKDVLSRVILKHRDELKIPAFTFHDLRRSAATNWAEELKINSDVIELMLNHRPQNKLVATYQAAKRSSEQKAAWIEWGNFLEKKLLS
ncbi:tyrosine-type recombinase/integrase [Methylophaga sp. OBS3]|uniref:tyrosine-type recombinase/integrase n=1 Tax=Methylophaga sp. OBS3 TaxID=2991934 RepID=UPI00225371D7|nr:site-specific integrase [Methylophaga sp. OBS3]MCX4190804.1 tyrosine-type recombinase/integrase [Methylophaga sp. OBS3]